MESCIANGSQNTSYFIDYEKETLTELKPNSGITH